MKASPCAFYALQLAAVKDRQHRAVDGLANRKKRRGVGLGRQVFGSERVNRRGKPASTIKDVERLPFNIRLGQQVFTERAVRGDFDAHGYGGLLVQIRVSARLQIDFARESQGAQNVLLQAAT